MTGPAVEVLDVQPVVDSIMAALAETVPDWRENRAPTDPARATPYGVAWISAGTPTGWPYAPGRELVGTCTLHGVGTSVRQARDVAVAGRTRLLAGDVDVEGRRLSITPDDTPEPYPEPDDSTAVRLYVQALVFDWQLD